MGRNRYVRRTGGEDFSQVMLVVVCSAFVCLCVGTVIVILKVGGSKKGIITVFDVALLEKEAPVLLFQPGNGRYENSDSCCICMEDFQPNEEISQIQKCAHRLHPSCLEQWVIRNQQCPLCKVHLLLTRELVLINSKKAKLHGTEGLNKREIAQIESRLQLDQNSNFYFIRPPPKPVITISQPKKKSQINDLDGGRVRSNTKKTRSRKINKICKRKCSRSILKKKDCRTNLANSLIKEGIDSQSELSASSLALPTAEFPLNEQEKIHVPPDVTLNAREQPLEKIVPSSNQKSLAGGHLDTSSAHLL